ncbi:MAG: ABC transporter substrate-binding protein, partial [Chloroflexota bacterium]
MKRILILALAIVVLAIPAAAQETTAPGEGDPVIWPNFGGDPTNFNPILYSDGPSGDIVGQIWLSFISPSPLTGTYEAGAAEMLVDSWEISEDGLTYTFTLKEDYVWSDGEAITSEDVLFTYEALTSGDLESPRLEDFPGVVSLETPDDFTVVINFSEPDCASLEQAATFVPLPEHRLAPELGGDFSLLNEAEFNVNPDVVSGPFLFQNLLPGEQVILVANPLYTDTPVEGGVIPLGYLQRQLENRGVQADLFLDDEITVIDSLAVERMDEFRELDAADELQYFEGLSSGWQFLGFNLADPENPVDGVDEDGNLIEQPPHPIFSDVRVRQAVIYATDHAALNEAAFGGIGLAQVSPFRRGTFFYDETLEPYPFDPSQAMALLDEAGWVDHDDDPETPRIADGAL